jgi:hypothetical protein
LESARILSIVIETGLIGHGRDRQHNTLPYQDKTCRNLGRQARNEEFRKPKFSLQAAGEIAHAVAHVEKDENGGWRFWERYGRDVYGLAVEFGGEVRGGETGDRLAGLGDNADGNRALGAGKRCCCCAAAAVNVKEKTPMESRAPRRAIAAMSPLAKRIAP